MICLYNSDDTDCSSNGIKTLNPISCTVTEEINGDYSVKLVMPAEETDVRAESIIRVPTPDGPQPFRVYNPITDVLGTSEFAARHIFYDLAGKFIVDRRPTGNGTVAITAALEGTGFTGISDIEKTDTAYYQMVSPLQAIMGADNAVIKVWGGEIERDGRTVFIRQRRGADRGISIRYRKNLTGLQININMDGVLTRIYPTGRKEDGQTLLKLPEEFVDSPLIGKYSDVKTGRVDYPDIKVGDGTTENQALQKLRDAAAQEFVNGIDQPSMTCDVEFVSLAETEEYKDYAVLERVYIGDTVTVHYDPLGMDITARVVAYEYDAIAERYNSITLGDAAPDFGSSIAERSRKYTDQMTEQTKSMMQIAIDNATDLLTTAMGGYVVKREGELLIMDTENPLTAKKVWRWNLNGLGYSKTGINGPYGTAITMDGAIVASYITTGILNAGLVRAGRLVSPSNPNVFFDLDTGENAFSKLIGADSNFSATIGKGEGREPFEGLFLKLSNNLVGYIGVVNDYYTGLHVNSLGSLSLSAYANDNRPFLSALNISESLSVLYGPNVNLSAKDSISITATSGEVQLSGGGKNYSFGASGMDTWGNKITCGDIYAGTIYSNGAAVTSDRDKKTNITAAEPGALEKIQNLNFYRYHMKSGGSEQYGIMYDEAPEEIRQHEGGTKAVNLYAFISLVAQAVKEVNEKVDKIGGENIDK